MRSRRKDSVGILIRVVAGLCPAKTGLNPVNCKRHEEPGELPYLTTLIGDNEIWS